MLKTFRILVANQPKLMRELLVEMLTEESWIEIVGEVAQEAEIRESVQKTSPDLLVVTADKPGKPLAAEVAVTVMAKAAIAMAGAVALLKKLRGRDLAAGTAVVAATGAEDSDAAVKPFDSAKPEEAHLTQTAGRGSL